MIKIYNTDLQTNKTEESQEYNKGAWINMTAPTDDEIKKVCSKLKISEDFLKYPLDSEEKARIDIDEEEKTVLFIVDVPVIEKQDKEKVYSTMPLGMLVVRDDFFVTISLKQNKVISDLEKLKDVCTYKKSRLILQIFYKNAELYLNNLKKINKETEVAESVLKSSLKNKELLKMLSLEKSLVYFTTSLKANEIVMEKTLRGKIIKLYDEDEDILEDAIIENKQAIEMSKIYSDILNGTMDAYASIISNNLNGVMKFLTSITIILAIPTMIASYWGMNVDVPMQFSHSPWAFYVVVAISIILGLIAMIWLKKKDMLD
ncbi:MAG: magnesium transporter CorA family protein [Clostridia bacterium]|nr:magnesium transporter CorA family protein [Clostridia bacterium]